MSRADHVKKLKCFKEVDKRLKRGDSMASIVRFIQKEKKEWTNWKVATARRVLYEYIWSLDPMEVIKSVRDGVIKEIKSQGLVRRISEFVKGCDEIKSLQDLIKLQKKRIEIALKLETKATILLKGTVFEVKEMRELLEVMAKLKMDLGILQRVPEEINANITAVAGLPPIREQAKDFGGGYEAPERGSEH